MSFYALTDVGAVRKMNQDCFDARQIGKATLLTVCDGMGGAASGDVAAAIAKDIFTQRVTELIIPETAAPDDFMNAFLDAVPEAGNAIMSNSIKHPEREGMGTTLVAAAIVGNAECVVANIGDSRAYHITHTSISRVTTDHSFVYEMIKRGEITYEQARFHPKRNLLVRALGTDTNETPDIFRLTLGVGEGLLLCSDGLNGVLGDEEIYDVVRHAVGTKNACENLVNAALERGAPDNVTVALYVNDGRSE